MKVLAKTLWVFLFLILRIAKFSVCIGICRENEQQALERLKKEAYDPSYHHSCWIVGKDCCEWKGVVCHNLTRHVIELHISRYLRINNLEWLPSLLNLENLEINSVDLSKATNWLQVINMLPSLVELRLYNCSLQHISPLLYHNFSSLEALDLSWNNFNSHVPKWIFNLPGLISINMTGSNFIGPFPQGPVNLTSLKTFRASSNSFNCPLPGWLLDLNNLEYLELRENNLEGVVSNLISNLSSLTQIDLSDNILSGKLPTLIGKLSKLELLDLTNNLFEGEVSELFNGMSDFLPIINYSSLRYLELSNNKLTGRLPESLSQLQMLESFDISDNRLEGVVTESHFTNLTRLWYFIASMNNLTLKVSQNWIPPFQATYMGIGGWNIGPLFPKWLQTQKQIISLDISNGGIEGEVPTWFWRLSSQFELLNLSHNQFVGEVPFISTPSRLSGRKSPLLMYLGSNNFTGPLPQISNSVGELDLFNNSFSGGLSHLFCATNKSESYKLEVINLGKNVLSGEIPECWMNWPELKVIILRDNNLIGGIPRSMEVLSNLKSLDFRRNRLTGPLSSSLGNCKKLQKMDIAENELAGQLPSWLGMRLSNLMILSLRSNKFYGELPLEICHLKDLQILDLANNRFFGIIPRCIGNLTAMITGNKLVAANDIELDFFSYFGVFVRENAIVTTKGNIYQYDTILALLTSMDMSNNNLVGDIPVSFTSLIGLRYLNFSKNHLAGRIPNGIGDMKVLESVDLSENRLYGEIPQSFSSLSTLSFLNLSYNNLSGKIPVSTQLQSFNPSSFQGNELCGLPLLEYCSSNGPDVDTEKNESDEDELDWFYISMSIGFGLSFWGVCSCLLFKRSWRHAYYRFLDSCWESLCVKLQIWGWI